MYLISRRCKTKSIESDRLNVQNEDKCELTALGPIQPLRKALNEAIDHNSSPFKMR